MSRIGIRMLIGQHIALTNEPARKDYVGIICTRTNCQALAQEAIDNARFICEDYYGLFDAPKVQLICRPDLEFMYVPGYVPPSYPFLSWDTNPPFFKESSLTDGFVGVDILAISVLKS
jgi:hypothetical protein